MHSRSLLSVFLRIIFKQATGEIPFFQLISVAEDTGLNLALSETPKTGFEAKKEIDPNHRPDINACHPDDETRTYRKNKTLHTRTNTINRETSPLFHS